jgi:uncharacterized protein YbaP (TraB family)
VPKPQHGGMSLDEHLQSNAREQNIPLIGLETTRDQFSIFTQLSTAESISLLNDTLNNLEQIRQLDSTLEQLYLQRDMQKIIELSSHAYIEVSDKALREKLVQGIIHARNQTLFSKALPELEKGNRFMAVGVLHLPHEDGILAQLESAGYFIFPASSY